uniref:BOS complex subunit NCLN isoform X2 n=1 Tax=Myxine glutinosa TaxID=7769 RepID=UPI00358F1270
MMDDVTELLLLLPTLLLLFIGPGEVCASHEFTAWRAQQYELYGIGYGSRSAVLSAEVRPVNSGELSRRCVIVRLADLTLARVRRAVSLAAAALLVLLPPNLGRLSPELMEQFQEVEQELLTAEMPMPVYFAHEDSELLAMHKQLQDTSSDLVEPSAAGMLLRSATANGFQFVASGGQSKPLPDWPIVSLEGRLAGLEGNEDLPTVVLVAHYDTFGVAPGLSFGADSNGSGVVALLELARLFSRLYAHQRTHAPFNLLFLFSGGGKFSYQGTKRWLEDNLDHTDSSWLQDSVAFALCLDTLGSSDALNVHVSRPPRDGTPIQAFLQELEKVSSHYPPLQMTLVHKKINLAEELLCWEHERFGLRRIPALSISHLDSPHRRSRHSILDVGSKVNVKRLTRNVKVVAEALAHYLYNLTGKETTEESEIFTEEMGVRENELEAQLEWLSREARAAQLVQPDVGLLPSLEAIMNRHLHEVHRHTARADKREPEFVFYDQLTQVINAYRVKPAIFDLILALCIAGYLGMVYIAVQNVNLLFDSLRRLTLRPKQQ